MVFWLLFSNKSIQNILILSAIVAPFASAGICPVVNRLNQNTTVYYGLVFCLFSWPYMVKWHNSGIINLFIQSVPPHGAEHTTKQGSNLSVSLLITHPAQERLATPSGSTCPTLFEQSCGSFYVPQEPDKWKCCEAGPTVFRPYPGRVGHDSNRLQMSSQGQHFLLSYLKTLRVVSARVWACDLLFSRPALSQLS